MHRYHIDESLPIFVVLQTAADNDFDLRKYIDGISVNVELKAYGDPSASSAADSGGERSPSRNEDTVWSYEPDASNQPIILSREPEDSLPEQIWAVWILTAKISLLHMV